MLNACYILVIAKNLKIISTSFWLRQELRESVCPSVCPSGTKCSKALNLPLSLIGLSQVSFRSLCAYFVIFFQNDSEWLEMDFKRNFIKCDILMSGPLVWV